MDRDQAKEKLIAFTKYTFPEFEEAKHHEILCEKLQAVETAVREKKGYRLMVFMPPRHTKSELVSRRFPAWVLGRNPNWQIISATYSGEFAADFGRDVRNIVNSHDYQNVFQGVELAPDSKAASRWNTNKGGVFVAAGVGGPITGRGAHIFNIDDPFKDWEEANSEAIRNHRWNWYLSVARTRLMPGGAVIITMTRWHDDDLAGRLIKEMEKETGEKFDILCLPALAGDNDKIGRKKGEPLWPEWYPEKELNNLQRLLPKTHWNALYQQNPIPEEGDYFKREDVQFYFEPPKHLRLYGASDYAVTEGGGDWTEHGIAGLDANDDLYVLDWWYGQTQADEWIESMLDLVKRHEPLIWFGEAGQIRRAVEPFLNKRMRERRDYCRIEWMPSISDKPTRARAIQARVSQRKVFLPADKEWADRLLQQMVRFPAGAEDDGVDVMSIFGRAIDKFAIGYAEPEKQTQPKDSWQIPEEIEENWKVA